MTAAIRVAVVGLGKIAQDQHLPTLIQSDQFQLVATVDRDGRDEPGVPSFSRIEDLAGSGMQVDAVAICTPPQVRHAIAQSALLQGWHVLLEKPPGATLAEVVALRDTAAEHRRTLFAAWHSRFAAAVEPARAWLAVRDLRRVAVTWREDVRVWHPGQAWIWQPGGFGVFDPGINALSILTRILPGPLLVENSQLSFPSNVHAPIAAQMTLRGRSGFPIDLDLDFREEGPQQWDIAVETDAGTLELSGGGANMAIDGAAVANSASALQGEYPELYRRFALLIGAGTSEVDVAPLRLVADAFLCGRMAIVEPFLE